MSEDSVTATRGSARVTAFPTLRSCSGLVKLCRKPTATASTPSAASFSIAPLTLVSSSSRSISPWALTRSRIGRRRRRGTNGSGSSMLWSYCSNRFSWRISTTSLKLSVVSRAVLAPFLSISAFVAKVVPWMMTDTVPGSMPASVMTACNADSTPSSGARNVVRVFAVNRRSPTSSATSVNVPPMSTPIRAEWVLSGVSTRGNLLGDNNSMLFSGKAVQVQCGRLVDLRAIHGEKLLRLFDPAQCVAADRYEPAAHAVNIGEGRRDQHRLLDRPAHGGDPAGLVDRWPHHREVESLGAADISVEHLADMQT